MWELTCKLCQTRHTFSNKSNYNRALRGNGLCNSCARRGQKRSPEQCQRISETTKKAMNTPEIYERFIASYTPENRKHRSDNAKSQMQRMFSNPELLKSFMKKQREKGKIWWDTLDNKSRQELMDKVHNGCKRMWANPDFRKQASSRMKGENNPFYGKKHSPETIEKLRRATTERLLAFWKSNKLIGINTKPELKMQKLLEVHEIEYTSPFVLKNKIYDLYLPKHNILIEVDGCYWHSKNVPLEKMNTQQLRRWKNDRYKDDLARKSGYKLLRVWEDEIDNFNVEKELIYE